MMKRRLRVSIPEGVEIDGFRVGGSHMPGGLGARVCLGLGTGFGIRSIMLALNGSCYYVGIEEFEAA